MWQQDKEHNKFATFTFAEWYCLFLARQPTAGQELLIREVSRSHTTTHHNRHDSPGWVISLSHRPLPDNTRHSQQTNIHTAGGIRTHNLSRRATADPHLRSRGKWDRQIVLLGRSNKWQWDRRWQNAWGESKCIFKISVRKRKVRNQLEDRIVDGRIIH